VAEYLAGINNAWFKFQDPAENRLMDCYGTDLGRNQFSGTELWHWPHSEDISHIDFSKPEQSPKPSILKSRQNILEAQFQKIAGIDVVRMWLFEKLEGLVFDSNRKVTGIDEQLLSNVDKILQLAGNHRFKVYFCLFDSWAVEYKVPGGLPQHRIPQYDAFNKAVQQTTKSIVESPSDFISNVLNPLVQRIKNNPNVYAIDVINEPEGMMRNTPLVSEQAMKNYISVCCNALKPIKSSVGCMEKETAMRFSSLPVDFCDFHYYSDLPNRLDNYRSIDYANKPCIIGEFGKRDSAGNVSIPADFVRNFMQDALNKGYSASLAWGNIYDFPRDSLQVIKDMSARVVPKPSFWERFLQALGMWRR